MSEEAATLGAAKAVTSQGNDFHSFIRCVCGGLFTCMSRDASLNVECVLNSYLNPRPQSHSLTHSGLLLFSLAARATIHMCTPSKSLKQLRKQELNDSSPSSSKSASASVAPPLAPNVPQSPGGTRLAHAQNLRMPMCSCAGTRVCRANVRAPCVTLVHGIMGQGLQPPRKVPPRLLLCARRNHQRIQGCGNRRRKGCQRCRWSSSRTLSPPHRRRKRRLFACVCVCVAVWRCVAVCIRLAYVVRLM